MSDYGDIIPTRRSLLSRLKNWDDQESWREFFNTYWKLLFNVARKSGLSDAEAEDVVQETIIAVARQMPGFTYDPSVGTFKGWLLHITRWKIGDLFRRRRRAERNEAQALERGSLPDPSQVVSSEFEQVWEHEWKQNILATALARVKERVSAKQYQIYDLYVVKNWPVEGIVTTLKVSRNQVYLAQTRISALMDAEIELLNGRDK
jgi:RNA polymerase sigma factor (sigma-70 family)